MSETDPVYHGYALPEGQLVTRNHVPFTPLDWGLVIGDTPIDFGWGKKGLGALRLAFNVLFDSLADRDLAALWCLDFASELFEVLPANQGWTLESPWVRDWAEDKMDSASNEPKPGPPLGFDSAGQG